MQITKLDQMFENLKLKKNKRVIAASANDSHTILAIHEAVKMSIVDGILVGDQAIITRICAEHSIDPGIFTIYHESTDTAAAASAVELIHSREGDFLMKGLISSDRFMKAVLNKEKGLMPPGAVLHHVTVTELSTYHKLLIFGDVAIIPLPDLSQKVTITNTLIRVAQMLGNPTPKVGLVAISEQVLPKIQSCVDAAIICKMAQRGQIKGAIVEGPLAMDLLVDKESAEIKGVKSEVCGDVDCILFPNVEAGNVFYKSVTKLMHAELGAVVVGASVPIVLTSRGDSDKCKLLSIALAAMMC
ncbi:MAG: phosphate butyryltransferase [Candidatus Cloacimonetes bacterium]|nr:phosphate butyryltransferase [Candidatus Cloacimonadota bacterium]